MENACARSFLERMLLFFDSNNEDWARIHFREISPRDYLKGSYEPFWAAFSGLSYHF